MKAAVSKEVTHEKMTCTIAALALLAYAGAVPAQSIKQPPQHNITETLDSWITHGETLVVGVADAMPADNYSFAPPKSFADFNGVRTFGEQLKHLSANNYRMAALSLGEKPTAEMQNETGPDSAKTKAEITDYVTGSFVVLHKAVATIDAQNAARAIASPSSWQKNRLSFAVDAVAHDMDHYGQLVEYLRMNGIVPPDSRPKKP